MTEREKQLVEGIKNILPFLDVSFETRAIHSVYKTPAQGMRDAAAEIELRDKAILCLRALVARNDTNPFRCKHGVHGIDCVECYPASNAQDHTSLVSKPGDKP